MYPCNRFRVNMYIKLLLLKLPSLLITVFLLCSAAFGQSYQDFVNETDVDKKCRLADELSQRYMILDLDSMKMTGEHLLAFSNKKQNKKGINLAYYILGDYFTRTAKEQKGLELLREAKNHYLSNQDYNKITRIYNAIGIAYQHIGNYKEASKWYKHSLKYGELASDEYVTNMALINLAQAQQAMEEYDAAIENAEKYKDWVMKLGAFDFVSNAFAVLGSIALDQEKYDRAVYYFEQCYKFAEKMDDNAGKGHAYTNIGIARYLQGDKEASEECFLKALEYRKKVRHISMLCDAYLNYGGILFEQQKQEEAIKYYKEGLRVAQQHKKYSNEIELLEALKEAYTGYDDKQLVEVSKMMEDATTHLSKLNESQEKLDELLTLELRESERIRKSGFVSENNKWPFYVGAVILLAGVFFVALRKKLT